MPEIFAEDTERPVSAVPLRPLRTPTGSRAPSIREVDWIQRSALWYLVTGIVPGVVAFIANFRFIRHHFYIDGPYLLDAGWISDVIYRSGVYPKNRPLYTQTADYYGIHVSPLVSLASLASYVVPAGRVAYFAGFIAALYAVVASVPSFVVRPHARTPWLAAVVGAAALAFAFGGQLLSCVGFPHYEVIIAGGICLFVAGACRGNSWIAWAGAALAICAREDGGLHVALFALAARIGLLPLARPRLAKIAVVGTLASLAAFALQLSLASHASLFRTEFIGSPPFGQIDAPLIARRLERLWTSGSYLYLPFLFTVAIASVRRDARFLLGWLVELPFFLLNLLAVQDLKARFEIYSAFPFIGSTFWVCGYAMAVEGRRGAWRPFAYLIALSVASLVGFRHSLPGAFAGMVRAVLEGERANENAIETFASKLRHDPRAYGDVLVDEGVAAWTLESTRPGSVLPDAVGRVDLAHHDGVLFFRGALTMRYMTSFLAHSPYTRCGSLPGTAVYFCGRDGGDLPEDFTPDSLLLSAATLTTDGPARRDGVRVVVDAVPSRTIAVFGPYVTLPTGIYEVSWDVARGACETGDGPGAVFDVNSPRLPERAERTLEDVESPRPTIRFAVQEASAAELEFRVWAGRCRMEVRAVRLRAL